MTPYTRFIRPVFAWLLACLLAAVILTLGSLIVMIGGGFQGTGDGALVGASIMGAGLGLFVLLTILVVTALPWLAICWIVHLTSAPRRWVLPAAGGLLGAASWLLMVVTQSGFNALSGADLLSMAIFGVVGMSSAWLYSRMTRQAKCK